MGKRKAYTPFSTSSEAGVTAAPVEGFIDVTQDVRPIIDTGFIDSKGRWIGHVTSDKSFDIYHKDDAIANGVTFLTPDVNPDGTWPLDMTGYSDIFIAIKTNNAGSYKIEAVMGPDSLSFANLSPVDAAATLRGVFPWNGASMGTALQDADESLTADVWEIFMITARLANWKLLQFKITNDSGGTANIETAFLRIV